MSPRRRRPATHPAHVTADRLKSHVEKWHAKMDGQERDDFSHVIQVLEEIGRGLR
jgi:hypothetical protein